MSFRETDALCDLYCKAKQQGYGFFANNIADTNTLVGLLEGYSSKRSDLIVQISSGAAAFAGGGNKLAGLRILSYTVRELARNYPIWVFINLDHFTVNEMDLIKVAIDEQLVTSIMIDASAESFNENVRISRTVKEMAEPMGILIEAELGKIKGVEDEISSDEAFLTDPQEAVEFVQRSRADLLAISVGTEHGVSKGKTITLRTDIARAINQSLIANELNIPLVLHGTSGLLPEQVAEMISYGICKLNKDTHYQYVYGRAAHDFYLAHTASIVPPNTMPEQTIDVDHIFAMSDWSPCKEHFDPRVVSKVIRKQIMETAMKLIDQVGSANKSIFR
ncbi:class II fructose-bisphosphate aldolase [Candidatus Acetothermia bacterium]|nr:class II fructose-bisphosphate aldolase [Candidatus Acetothermia bacterium]